MSAIGISADKGKKHRRSKKKKKDEEQAYQVSRYAPVLKDYLEDLISGDMSPNDFPFCGDEPPQGYGAVESSKPAAKSLKATSRKKK